MVRQFLRFAHVKKLATFLAVTLVAGLVVLTAGRRSAAAVSTGPTIDMSSSTVLVSNLNDPIDLTFATTGTTTAAYKGYQVAVTYDSSKVAIDTNGPADRSKIPTGLWPDDSCTSAWDPVHAQLNCVGTASTTNVGQIASAHFRAVGTGAAVFTFRPNPAESYTVDDSGPQSNTLTCNGASPGSSCQIIVNIMPPDVQLGSLSASDPSPAEGAPETITYSVSNGSTTTTATGVAVTLQFPNGLIPDNPQADPHCVVDAQTVTCTHPAGLAPGGSWSGTVTATAHWAGVTEPTVTVSGDVTTFEADPNPANNHFELSINNGAAVDVSATLDRIVNYPKLVPGDLVQYAVHVTNPSPTLTVGITLTATLPPGLEAFLGVGADSCTPAGQTITCSVASLAENTTKTITLRASANGLTVGSSLSSICSGPGGVAVTTDRVDPNDANNHPCDDGTSVPVIADDDGDGYSNEEELALGENPNLYCAIMRADINDDHVVGITTDVQFIYASAGSVGPSPARFDQAEIQLSDGALRGDGVINNADAQRAMNFIGRSVIDCRN